MMVQALIISRNIVKSMAQMGHGSKYSPESVFPDITAAIVDAKAPIPQSVDIIQNV